jgi:flagellar FliL protein
MAEDRDASAAKDDETGTDDAEGTGGKKKKKLPGKIIVLGVVLPLLLLGGGGAYFMGLFGGGKVDPAEAKRIAEAERRKKVVYFQLPEMLVNLNTQGANKVHYLKLSISLELPDQTEIPKVQAAMPRIVDNFQIYLRELRVEDLRGSAGLYRLREELLTRVNTAAAPAKVSDVLFKEMLIQ